MSEPARCEVCNAAILKDYRWERKRIRGDNFDILTIQFDSYCVNGHSMRSVSTEREYHDPDYVERRTETPSRFGT